MKKTLSIILAILMIVTTIPIAFAADVVKSGNCGADGDKMCDNGGEQLTCEDCGRPVHEDTLVQNFICWLVMLVNLIKSMF